MLIGLEYLIVFNKVSAKFFVVNVHYESFV